MVRVERADQTACLPPMPPEKQTDACGVWPMPTGRPGGTRQPSLKTPEKRGSAHRTFEQHRTASNIPGRRTLVCMQASDSAPQSDDLQRSGRRERTQSDARAPAERQSRAPQASQLRVTKHGGEQVREPEAEAQTREDEAQIRHAAGWG